MNQKTTGTWIHNSEQRTGLETDSTKLKEIITENLGPKTNKIEIAERLIEGVKGRDTIMIITKRELNDLILKDNEESEKNI
ncbi:hypothetical protein [Flavobacterium sp. LB1P71]|uniref:hypothetical protein n=1 Tax=Flavobacterium sp. LB1P71 TaxID=3401716 RepID=UPI003AAB1ACE